MGTFYKEGPLSKKHTGTVGAIGCLSFNGNKIITAGGGGIILSDNKNIAVKAKYLTTQAKDDPIKYIHNEIGYNFRLTNIQAALGLAQMEQLPQFLALKKDIHSRYRKEIEDIYGLSIAKGPNYSINNYWLNILKIDFSKYERSVEDVLNSLAKHNIQTRPVWKLNHSQKPFVNFEAYKISKAIKLVKSSLCIPSSSNLSEESLSRVINCLKKK